MVDVPEELIEKLRQELGAMPADEQRDAVRVVERLRRAPGSRVGFLSHLLDLHWELVEPGHTRCTMPITPKVRNSTGFVHGGAIFTLIDYAMGSTVERMLAQEPGARFATVEVKINFLAAIAATSEGTLLGDARVAAAGTRIVVLECRVTDLADDRLVALATGSFYIIRPG